MVRPELFQRPACRFVKHQKDSVLPAKPQTPKTIVIFAGYQLSGKAKFLLR
jgi:hypothetical protein